MAYLVSEYSRAGDFYDQREYDKAIAVLENIREYKYTDDFLEVIERTKKADVLRAQTAILDRKYKHAEELLEKITDQEDAVELLAYSRICQSDDWIYKYNEYCMYIPEGYDGHLSDIINADRVVVNHQYSAIMQYREEKKQEEERLRTQELEESIKYMIPYVGMEEKYVSSTCLGTAYYYGANTIHTPNGGQKKGDIYYYYRGSSVIYTVRCVDGIVHDIRDYRDKPWNRKYVFKSHPYVNGTYVGGKQTEDHPVYDFKDSYDLDWYDDPEDFADDWEDEFESWEDAYDYWEEHINDE